MRPIRSLRRTKASKRGSSQPSRKISVVSNPPSVWNRPPPSCGSRSRYFACLATVFRSLSWGVGTSTVGGENAGFACDDLEDLRYRASGAEVAEFQDFSGRKVGRPFKGFGQGRFQ